MALIAGYMLLGACWLNWRCEGALQAHARRLAAGLAPLVLLAVLGLVIWTCALDPLYLAHLKTLRFSLPLAALGVVCAAAFYWSLARRRDWLPLLAVLGGVICAFGTLLLAIFPFILPPQLRYNQAAAPPLTQLFTLAVFALLVPVTLAYNTFGFWVFHGKIHDQSPR